MVKVSSQKNIEIVSADWGRHKEDAKGTENY